MFHVNKQTMFHVNKQTNHVSLSYEWGGGKEMGVGGGEI